MDRIIFLLSCLGIVILAFLSKASALSCFTCYGVGKDNPCHLRTNLTTGYPWLFEKLPSTVTVQECVDPTEAERNKGYRAACIMALTEHKAYSSEGYVSRRECELVDYHDTCWTQLAGGNTAMHFCTCSDRDKCNNAPTVTVPYTLLIITASLLATMNKLI